MTSRPQAEAGTLIYLVGGEAEALDRARPVLDVLGGSVHHVGPVSQGMALKLAVNALFGIQVAAVGEFLGFLRASEVPESSAASLLAEMPVVSPAIRGVMGLMASQSYAPMFPIDLVEKDFRYVSNAASSVDVDVPMASCAQQVYAKAQHRGLGADNIAGVVQLYIPDRAPDASDATRTA